MVYKWCVLVCNLSFHPLSWSYANQYLQVLRNFISMFIFWIVLLVLSLRALCLVLELRILSLFLDSLFCFMDLCVCPSVKTIQSWSLLLCNILKSGRLIPLPLLFFTVVLAILIPLYCQINFRIILHLSTKIVAGIFIVITLNLYINLGRIYIFTVWRLPIYEHDMLTYLFRPSMFSFFSIVLFSSYEFHTCFVGLTLTYFIFWTITNSIEVLLFSIHMFLVYTCICAYPYKHTHTHTFGYVHSYCILKNPCWWCV